MIISHSHQFNRSLFIPNNRKIKKIIYDENSNSIDNNSNKIELSFYVHKDSLAADSLFLQNFNFILTDDVKVIGYIIERTLYNVSFLY